MIKFHPERKIIRRCTAPFEIVNDKGETETHQITVEYYSLSTSKIKEMRESVDKRIKDGDPLWYSDLLSERLHALPDLVDGKNKPYKITLAFLESLDAGNVEAIVKAIDEDGRPKAQPEK